MATMIRATVEEYWAFQTPMEKRRNYDPDEWVTTSAKFDTEQEAIAAARDYTHTHHKHRYQIVHIVRHTDFSPIRTIQYGCTRLCDFELSGRHSTACLLPGAPRPTAPEATQPPQNPERVV